MTTLRNRFDELEELVKETHQAKLEDIYCDCLDQLWEVGLYMKGTNDSYPLERAIDLQEQYDAIKKKLPSVSDEEFEEFVCLTDVLGVLLDY